MENSKIFAQNTKQIKLLKKLIDKFSYDRDIRAIIVRGSISKGLSDQYSDIDIVLIVNSKKFKEFCENIPKKISAVTKLLTREGWIDTNVPNFGGLGYVFLVKYENSVIQLDTYLLPEDCAKRIIEFNDKIIVYQKGEINYSNNFQSKSRNRQKEISIIIKNCDEKFQAFLDILLHFEMLSKYIARKDPFLAYKYWYLLNTKFLFLVRRTLEPETADFMYYDIHRHLDKYHSRTIADFSTHLKKLSIFDYQCFEELFHIFQKFLKENYPEIYQTNKLLINEVRQYAQHINSSVKADAKNPS